MALSLASAVAAVSTFITKMETVITTPEDDNKRWRKVSSETPYVSPSVMCSDDVEVKFKDGHTSVGFISFDGRWFNHYCDEIKRPDCWRPLEDNN